MANDKAQLQQADTATLTLTLSEVAYLETATETMIRTMTRKINTETNDDIKNIHRKTLATYQMVYGKLKGHMV